MKHFADPESNANSSPVRSSKELSKRRQSDDFGLVQEPKFEGSAQEIIEESQKQSIVSEVEDRLKAPIIEEAMESSPDKDYEEKQSRSIVTNSRKQTKRSKGKS